jgi:DNA-binding MarR family transcriptional regulator
VTPRPSVEDQIIDRYESLMRHLAVSHRPEFLGVDITMPQAKVLYVVSGRPGISMSALASELHVGLSATSGLVDRLVASGYLDRREDSSDRRQQLVTITTAGSSALDRMRELRSELMRRLIAGLQSDELGALLTSFNALDREAERLDDPSPALGTRRERTPA